MIPHPRWLDRAWWALVTTAAETPGGGRAYDRARYKLGCIREDERLRAAGLPPARRHKPWPRPPAPLAR